MTQQRHLFVSGPGLSRIVPLPATGVHRIGRDDNNWLVLADERQTVSRAHTEIECTEDGCTLQDLDSTNGTVLNDELLPPHTPRPLQNGDEIIIGAYHLIVHMAETAVSPPAPTADQTFTWLPDGQQYMQYLPGLYHNSDHLRRFLTLLQSVRAPLEWTIDNFDLFLDPATAPPSFLPWLAGWYGITFDASWPVNRRRRLLAEAHVIFRQRRGTRYALCRALEIYTGQTPIIDDRDASLPPNTFTVKIPWPERPINEAMVTQLIDALKPAHTSYRLTFLPAAEATS